MTSTITVTARPERLWQRALPISAWSLVAVLVVPVPLLVGLTSGDAGAPAVARLLYPPLGLLGLVLCLLASRRDGVSAALRSAWRWAAAACALRLVSLTWIAVSGLPGATSLPLVVYACHAGFYPLMLVALLRFPVPTRRSSHRTVLLLDVFTIVAGSCAVLWQVLVSEAVQSGLGHLPTLLVLLLAVGDVVLVLGAARVALFGSTGLARAATTVLLTGLGLLVIGDVGYGWTVLNGTTAPEGAALDVAWLGGVALIAVAADVFRRSPAPEPEPAPATPGGPVSEVPPAPSHLPYLAALATLTLVGGAAASLPLHPYGGMLFAAIAVVLAVIVRQLVVSREHSRLVRLYELAAIEDALTGALSRRRLLELGERLAARGRAAVFVIDVDHFKTVNDSFGHLAGDQVLAEVSRRCLAALRPGDLLGRFGGDELVAVLPGADTGTARRCAERLHAAAVSEPVDAAGSLIAIGLSLGYAASRGPGPLAPLIERADSALYAAKAAGRGRVMGAEEAAPPRLPPPVVARPAPAAPAAAAPRPLNGEDLADAMRHDLLLLHHQPRLHLRSGTVTSCESLVRWNHPERGLLLPGAFLPQLDRQSLASLTERVLELALADCAQWRRGQPDCRVSVNVPPVLLRDPWLPARVTSALRGAGLPPSALELEVTEEAISDDAQASHVTAELRAEGVRIAIDDFGQGTTSLDTLRRHQVDVLKIDRCFLDGGLTDSRDRAVVRAMTTLGHELGLAVTAEGVEDAATFDALAALGVDEVQGTVFARPLPLERLLAFLGAHQPRPTMPMPMPRESVEPAGV